MPSGGAVMEKRSDFELISRYKTALMGVAALMIYFFHQWAHQWVRVPISPPWFGSMLTFAQRIGFYGVDIFLLLSGMGLIYAIEKHSLMRFYARRLQRVFLPFLLSAIAMALVSGWSMAEFLKKVLLYDFLFVNTFSMLWFVPMIIILYLLFPFYHRCFIRAKNKFVFSLLAVILWIGAASLFRSLIRSDLYSAINRVPIFLAGVYMGWLSKENPLSLRPVHWALVSAFFIIGLVLMYLTSYKDLFLFVPISNCCVPAFLMAVTSVFIFTRILALLDSFRPGKWLLWLLGRLGTISLELYCMHEWLDDIIRGRISISYEYCIDNIARIDLSIFLCVLAAALLLHFLCKAILHLTATFSQHIIKSPRH